MVLSNTGCSNGEGLVGIAVAVIQVHSLEEGMRSTVVGLADIGVERPDVVAGSALSATESVRRAVFTDTPDSHEQLGGMAGEEEFTTLFYIGAQRSSKLIGIDASREVTPSLAESLTVDVYP